MEASDENEFRRCVVQMHALYPGAQLSEATIPAWFAHLEDLPLRAVRLAFERAPSASPAFCPTAEQVKAIANVEALAMRVAASVQKQQTLLPLPPEVEPGGILQAFYSACDKLLGTGNDEKLEPVDVPALEGVSTLLFRWFAAEKYVGHTEWPELVDLAVARFREGNTDERKGPIDIGMLKPTVNHWRSKKYSTRQVVFGLRLTPQFFARYPTLGMFDELIQERRSSNWPEGFRRHGAEDAQGSATP